MVPHLSIVIPAWNEEERLPKTLVKIAEWCKSQPFECEVIVVDDGSADGTAAVARSFRAEPALSVRTLVQPRNMGKGAAVRRGMLEAAGEYRLFSDADLSTPIAEASRLLAELYAGADIAIGSRSLDRSKVKVHQPWYREAMGRVFNVFVQIFVLRGITDTQCGFKAFTGRAAEAVFSLAKVDGFSFDAEALFLAQKLGLSVHQCPVEWYNDERSTVNPISDASRMFLEILRIRRIHRATFEEPDRG